MPRLVKEGSPTGQAIGALHSALAWVLVALMSVHVLAAFIHLFIYRDRVMQRMLQG